MDPLITRLQAAGRLGKNPKQVVALAAFEDAHTETRVNEFCRSLGRQLGAKCEITQQMWLFNELRVLSIARHSRRRSLASADLVIISVHHAQSFPDEIQDWFGLWVGQKGSRPTALLALFDPVYVGDSTALHAYLKETARKGKMEFLVQAEESRPRGLGRRKSEGRSPKTESSRYLLISKLRERVVAEPARLRFFGRRPAFALEAHGAGCGGVSTRRGTAGAGTPPSASQRTLGPLVARQRSDHHVDAAPDQLGLEIRDDRRRQSARGTSGPPETHTPCAPFPGRGT